VGLGDRGMEGFELVFQIVGCSIVRKMGYDTTRRCVF
jgi:hypothetical protein